MYSFGSIKKVLLLLFFRNEDDTSTDSELFKGAASIESQRSIFFDKAVCIGPTCLGFLKFMNCMTLTIIYLF